MLHQRSDFSRPVNELGVIWPGFTPSSEEAVKTGTALVPDGVQRLVSSRTTGEAGIFASLLSCLLLDRLFLFSLSEIGVFFRGYLEAFVFRLTAVQL